MKKDLARLLQKLGLNCSQHTRVMIRALTKLKVALSLAVPSQAAAVQKSLAADVAFLRAAALVSHVEDEVRLLGVASAALRAGERPDFLRQVTGGSGIPVARAPLMTPQMSGLRETLAAILAAVLSLQAVVVSRIVCA